MFTQLNWEGDVIFDGDSVKALKPNSSWKINSAAEASTSFEGSSTNQFESLFHVENDEFCQWALGGECHMGWRKLGRDGKPKPLTLDMNDFDLVHEIPEDIDPASKQASLTNELRYNISNDEYYAPLPSFAVVNGMYD